MSNSRPLLAEIAVRTRGAIAIGPESLNGTTSSTIETIATPHFSTAARLPSSRPIDHRWDRSRGIVFSSQRPRGRNSLWESVSHAGLATGPRSTCPSIRTYASRDSARAARSVSRAPQSFTGSLEEFGYSVADQQRAHTETRELRDRIKALEVENANAILAHQKAMADSLAEQTTKHQQEMEMLSLKKDRELKMLTANVDRESYQAELTRQKILHEKEIARREEEHENRLRQQDLVVEAQRQAIDKGKSQQAEIQAQFQEEIDASRLEVAELQASQEDLRKQLADVSVDVAIKEKTIASQALELETALKQLRALEDSHMKFMKESNPGWQDEMRGMLDRTRSQVKRLEVEKQVLERAAMTRRERATKRLTYLDYRQIWYEGLMSTVEGLVQMLPMSANQADYWGRCLDDFRTSHSLRPLQARRPDVNIAIIQYLESEQEKSRAAHIKSNELHQKFEQIYAASLRTAHRSRELTKTLHHADATPVTLASLVFKHDHFFPLHDAVTRYLAAQRGPIGNSALMKRNYAQILRLFGTLRELSILDIVQHGNASGREIFLQAVETQKSTSYYQKIRDELSRQKPDYEVLRFLKQMRAEFQALKTVQGLWESLRMSREAVGRKLGAEMNDDKANSEIIHRMRADIEKRLETMLLGIPILPKRSATPQQARLARNDRVVVPSSRAARPRITRHKSGKFTFSASSDSGSSTTNPVEPNVQSVKPRKKRRRAPKKSEVQETAQHDNHKPQSNGTQASGDIGKPREQAKTAGDRYSAHRSLDTQQAADRAVGTSGFTPSPSHQMQNSRMSGMFSATSMRRPSFSRVSHQINGFPGQEPTHTTIPRMSYSTVYQPLPTTPSSEEVPKISPASKKNVDEDIVASSETLPDTLCNLDNLTHIAPAVESADDTTQLSSLDEHEVPAVLTFAIPPDDYRDAVMASRNSGAAFWTYKLYRGPQGTMPTVHYCTSVETAERQARLFLEEKVVGFDLEWEQYASRSHGPKQNVSLIQIASEAKIGLFHVACFKGETTEDLIPPSLRTILESPHIAKTGVNVIGDANRMQRFFDIQMKGLFELSHLYRVVKFSQESPVDVNFKLVGLAAQVENVLLLPLKKDEVRTSRWASKLNGPQTEYAAADAYAGFQLYHALDRARFLMNPRPPRPAFYESQQPLVLGDGTKVHRSERKSPGSNVLKKAGVDKPEEESEAEEFFDALEQPEVDGPPTPSDLSTSEVKYPVLPTPSTDSVEARQGHSQPPTQNPLCGPSTAGEAVRRGPELQSADTWVQSYMLESSDARPVSRTTRKFVSASSLRAYHLWHEQGFELSQVAALCRDPPLALSTVASYVMAAVKEERLPFRQDRIREAFDILPGAIKWRYHSILKCHEA